MTKVKSRYRRDHSANAGLTDVGGAQFVALCQHPAPRGRADDLGQATETPHGLFELEIEYGTELGS